MKENNFKTISEKIVYKLTKKHFFDLYVYHNQNIRDENGDKEIDDVLILFNNTIISIQIKERNYEKSKTIDIQSENKWFENKVLKKSNKQHKQTLQYLTKYSIEFCNEDTKRIIDFKNSNYDICYITIFENKYIDNYQKVYSSDDLGVYSIFSFNDFLLVCEDLLLPADIIAYIKFRTKKIYEYNKIRSEPVIVEKVIGDHTLLFLGATETNLLISFYYKLEFVDKKSNKKTTNRFISYITQLIDKKQNASPEEIKSTNCVLEKFSLMDSVLVKELYNDIDFVTANHHEFRFIKFPDYTYLIICNYAHLNNEKFHEKIELEFINKDSKAIIILAVHQDVIFTTYCKF